MSTAFSSFYKVKSFKGALLCAALSINATSAFAQTTSEAEADPKSILFPSGVAGPYFPSDNEIALQAQERLNSTTNDENFGNDIQEIIDNVLVQESLEIEDNSAFGTMTVAQGGYFRSIWQASTIDKIKSLLEVLKLPVKSPAMDEISKKLLLSVASAPTGEEMKEPTQGFENVELTVAVTPFDEELLKQFINIRIAELMERGNLTDLGSFIQKMPDQQLDISKENAELLLLSGDIIGACQMTESARETNDGDIFWLKMTSLCRVLEEDNTGAQIALDLLNEQGNIDFIFFDLISILMEDPAVRPNFMSNGLTSLDPLNYTILSLLDQPIEAELIESSSPLVLSALVINPNMSKENRFQAALKSYLSGGIAVDVLSDIYDLQEFSSTEINNAVLMVANDDRPLADTLLYQAASKQASEIEKAKILKVIWDRALLSNDLPRKALLNIDTLLSLNPSAGLINHAHHITRGLLLGGQTDKAIEWYDFVRRAAVSGDAEATRALINIWPLVMLASDRGSIPWNDDILELWWNGQMVLAPESRDHKSALFYALAEAFQYEVSEDKWLQLITDNYADKVHAVPLGVWRELIRSVGENKAAQAIILSLIAMSPDGPGSLDPSGISAVVRALRSIGLEKEARNIAIEAMSANDF